MKFSKEEIEQWEARIQYANEQLTRCDKLVIALQELMEDWYAEAGTRHKSSPTRAVFQQCANELYNTVKKNRK